MATAERAALWGCRHGEARSVACSWRGGVGRAGCRVGGEGAAVPLLTWLWVLQRGHVTRGTGSDWAVCRGLPCP